MRSSSRLAGTMAVALTFLSGGQALAQNSAGPVGDRTGPGAVPPPVPSLPPPAASLIAAPTPVTPPSPGGMIRFSDVVVDTDGTGALAFATGWRPTVDVASDRPLDHRQGEPVDADWVRRQFTGARLVGQRVPLDRIVARVQQINSAFVQNGYVNSGVRITGGAAQDDGRLRLTLVLGRLVPIAEAEPHVSVLWVDDRSSGLSQGYIRDRMRAAERTPLNAIALEREFRLLAENPAIETINADLRPGRRPGEATLQVTVDPAARSDLYLSYANSRSPAIGGERAALGGLWRNLLFAGDVVGLEAGVTSDKGDVSLSYEVPVFGTATTALLRGGYNEAAVVDRPLIPLDIQAVDWTVEAGLTHDVVAQPLTPLPEGRSWRSARSVQVGVRVSHRRSETSLLGRPFSFSPGSVDGVAEYTALRLTADWIERGIQSVSALTVTGTQGLEGTKRAIFGLASPDEDFRTINVQFSFARRLTAAGLELRMRVGAQASDGILYSGERLSAGGEYTVRGYRETLILADTGAIGSVELAQPFSLTGGRRDASGVDWGAFQAALFVDGAYLDNREGQQPAPQSIGSVGISLAWTPIDAFQARITYGEALVDAPIVGERDLQDRGVQFRLTLRPTRLFERLRRR